MSGLIWRPDLWIGLSYFLIFLCLDYARRRVRLRWSITRVGLAFFLVSHAFEHWMRLEGEWAPLSTLAACASVCAVLLVFRSIPSLIRMSSDLKVSESRRKMLEVSTIEMERWVRERVKELKLSNVQLRNSQREYHELVNTVDGIVWEAKVGEAGYSFVSRQAEKILGYPVEQWIKEPRFWQKILHPDDREQMIGDDYRLPEQKKDTQIEYRVVTADGRTLWMRDHIKIIEEPGAPKKMRGIMVDVTDRKRADGVKSEFLANMSHEIRTPLNAIVGMASVGLGDIDCLSTIKTAADSLLTIVNEILDYSKLEAQRVELELTDFKLSTLCKNAFEVVGPLAKAKAIELEMDISKDLPLGLRGDPGRLMQILMNLISNAIKFTDKSGRVGLRVLPAGAQVRFEVSDSGIGISEEVKKKLFAPFSQADSSTSRKFGGTGLGLSISKRLVTLMGGEIGLESSLRQGSMFWFEIPMENAHAPVIEISEVEQASPGSSEYASPEPIRVLVVDDNFANQKVILRMIEKLGHSGVAVANGEEALTSYERGIYDLILMDCQMPEMDGYEATRRIRHLEEGGRKARIPIVALTAHAMAGDRQKCKDSGMDDYLSKPVDLRLLRDILVRRHRRATPVIPCVVDRAYLQGLESLQTDGQPDLILELIDYFLSSGPECLSKIETAYEQKDFETVGKSAHRFKSTCHNVGAKKLAALCEKIELNPVGSSEAASNLAFEFADARKLLREIAVERRAS